MFFYGCIQKDHIILLMCSMVVLLVCMIMVNLLILCYSLVSRLPIEFREAFRQTFLALGLDWSIHLFYCHTLHETGWMSRMCCLDFRLLPVNLGGVLIKYCLNFKSFVNIYTYNLYEKVSCTLSCTNVLCDFYIIQQISCVRSQ